MNFKKFFNNFDWKLAFIIIILILAETFAQTFLEKSSLSNLKKKNENIIYLLLGIILYALVGYVYYLALQSDIPLAIVNVIWQAATIIIVSLVSALYFKQHLSTRNIIGIIIVAIGSMFFMPHEQATIGGQAIAGSDATINTREDMIRYLKALEKKDI